jgi:hypothetical protein
MHMPGRIVEVWGHNLDEETVMLREIIEWEVSAVRNAVHALRERIHPTTVMKRREFMRALDDLGQSPEDVEWQVQSRGHAPSTSAH